MMKQQLKDETDVSTKAQEVGTRIKELVQRLGSQQDVADDLGMTPVALRRWSKGEGLTQFMTVAQLCHMAGESIDELAYGESSTPKTTAVGQKAVESALSATVVALVLESLLEENTVEELKEDPTQASRAFIRAYEHLIESMAKDRIAAL